MTLQSPDSLIGWSTPAVAMATAQRARFPRIDRNCGHNEVIIGSKLHRSPGQKTDLPGIGSYVIDSPEDKNMGVRQQCLRYQEAHRGIIRAKIESLPDIPKRCHLKHVPVVTLKDSPTMTGSPVEAERKTPTRFRSTSGQNSPEELAFGKQNGKRDGRGLQQYVTRESATKILLPQEELVSRSPIGRLSQSLPCMHQSNVPITGFGVRKQKTTGRDFGNLRKEYTNLSVNVELAEPNHVTCKATERELDSQADYRRQLTFYLTPITNTNQGREKEESSGDGEDRLDDSNGSVLRNIPQDKIGSSTRNQIWASNVRLGELLVQQNAATPGLRRKVTASRTRSMGDLSRTGATTNNSSSCSKSSLQACRPSRPFIYGSPWNRFRTIKDNGSKGSSNRETNNSRRKCNYDDGDDDEDDDDDSEDEVWLNMADRLLIENGVYDRYANVKLPKCRMQQRGTARTTAWSHDCLATIRPSANRSFKPATNQYHQRLNSSARCLGNNTHFSTLLSRVRALPPAPWPDRRPESLRSPCCGLARYKNPIGNPHQKPTETKLLMRFFIKHVTGGDDDDDDDGVNDVDNADNAAADNDVNVNDDDNNTATDDDSDEI
ncbi:hypothetical protein PoB_001934900 [Plakobranchus ocellatus]|uniref:Uncharacterized protein n=1 Tax=Plakobranchus ocellatus TaxID=259542 RepID=A0AAV3ZG27_9GAST|nr:hypothetical protein PoB_001934900 [Plakobranchus ocellatus]